MARYLGVASRTIVYACGHQHGDPISWQVGGIKPTTDLLCLKCSERKAKRRVAK